MLKDDNGKIVATVIFEDERLNPLLQLVGFIIQSQLIMFFFVAKLVMDGAAGGAFLLMAMILLSPIFFVGYVLCSIFFGFNLVRAYLKGSSLGRKQGWHKQRKM